MTILGPPMLTPSQAQARRGRSGSWAPVPGVAPRRFEGVTKVTGQKIFARDFNARDLAEYGWPKKQWYGMYLRALTTTREFMDVNLDGLPAEIQPTKVVLGDDFVSGRLSTGLIPSLAPRLVLDRDRIVDQQLLDTFEVAKAKATAALSTDSGQGITGGEQVDHPSAVEFDLVVRQGRRADFLGQAVALLLFDDLKTYRAAKAQMQFRDAEYQVYGPEIGHSPAESKIFPPETLYVKKGDFSYYASNNTNDYLKDAKAQADKIEQYLEKNPDLVQQAFSSDMRAMDPMFMEPESGLIWFDPQTRKMQVLLGTQSPDGDLASICSMYGNCGQGNAVDEVTLISCYPGGGFGGRDKSPFSLMLALCADFADGHPVKLEYDRFEQFRVGLKRHACELAGSLAVSPDQKMQVVQMNMSFDGGGRKNLSPYVAQLASLCAGGSYRLPMANIHAKAIHSENISGGSQRGFGGPQAFFAIETAIDELCRGQGWDPLQMRRKNVAKKGDTTVVGGPINQQLRLEEMLDRTAEHPLWRDREAIKKGYAQRGKLYGTGIAMSLQAYGTSGDGVVAAVTLNPDGTWTVQSDAVDMGNGSATTLGVVIGPILGANASEVDMGGYTLFGQTGLCAGKHNCESASWDNPKYTRKGVGSSSACLTGLHQVHVVQQAARVVMATTVIPTARRLWRKPELTEEDVKWVDGALTTQGEDREPIPLAELAEAAYDLGLPKGVVAHAYFQEIWVSADYKTPVGMRRYELDGLAVYPSDGGAARPIQRQNIHTMDSRSARESRYVWAPCVNVVGLVVDRRSGEVEVQNILSVLNAGRIHVPELVSGQSQGGVAMAMGWTLFEDMPPGMEGPANGKWNLNRYHVPRYHDVPLARTYEPGGRSQELILMPETPEDKKQGRGIAEAVMCSIAPAISNALKDATGIRFTSLPITPQKIREGLRA